MDFFKQKQLGWILLTGLNTSVNISWKERPFCHRSRTWKHALYYLLTSYARDKYVKNPLNLMISIKDKYKIGMVYTIRTPGVHAHAWRVNTSPFLLMLILCVCRGVHVPLCHYWTCMHTLHWFMMKIHQIYRNISSAMYIYGCTETWKNRWAPEGLGFLSLFHLSFGGV